MGVDALHPSGLLHELRGGHQLGDLPLLQVAGLAHLLPGRLGVGVCIVDARQGHGHIATSQEPFAAVLDGDAHGVAAVAQHSLVTALSIAQGFVCVGTVLVYHTDAGVATGEARRVRWAPIGNEKLKLSLRFTTSHYVFTTVPVHKKSGETW